MKWKNEKNWNNSKYKWIILKITKTNFSFNRLEKSQFIKINEYLIFFIHYLLFLFILNISIFKNIQ